MTHFVYQGPIRLVAMDEDGRRFPCACHLEPAAWALIAVVPYDARGRIAYVTVPCHHVGTRGSAAQLFENALNSLDAFMAGGL